MSVHVPSARNVTIDTINLKSSAFVFIYFRLRTRGAQIDGKVHGQSMFKVALSGFEYVFAYVDDISQKPSGTDVGFLIWDCLAKVDVIGACHFRPSRDGGGHVYGEVCGIIDDFGDSVLHRYQ